MHAHIHTPHTHALSHMHTRTHAHAQTHTHARTHTSTHMHCHTHTHTHCLLQHLYFSSGWQFNSAARAAALGGKRPSCCGFLQENRRQLVSSPLPLQHPCSLPSSRVNRASDAASRRRPGISSMTSPPPGPPLKARSVAAKGADGAFAGCQ